MRLSLAGCCSCLFLTLSLAGLAAAQDDDSLEAKRKLVRAEMIREFADDVDSNFLQEIERKVAAMSPERIEQLVKLYQRRAQLAAQDGVGLGGRSVGAPGYAPVITTLPSGAQLGASAVVSPDRRYVRMNLQPFFSSVGPVQNFTFQQPGPYGGVPYYQPYYQPLPYYQPVLPVVTQPQPAPQQPARPVTQPAPPPKKKPAFRGGRAG
jgi:hypothetical protein